MKLTQRKPYNLTVASATVYTGTGTLKTPRLGLTRFKLDSEIKRTSVQVVRAEAVTVTVGRPPAGRQNVQLKRVLVLPFHWQVIHVAHFADLRVLVV